MIIHVTTINFLYQASLVFIGNAVACRLRAIPSARMIAARFAGITLIGFGVKLATNII
jgi:threonine/homoserine/homoserine lactone efflux protein